ncbi:MAG: TolC family protein, partial [Syntrophaceae bacterium]|nr:TolC family protein [Syntrophaceae bacterium]
MKNPFFNKVVLTVAVVIMTTGCAVGPNFRTPEFKIPAQYTPTPLPEETVGTNTASGRAQRFAFAEDLTAQWWNLFRSPELDTLIRQGLTESPSLAAAQAAIRKAEENLRAAQGVLLFPNIDASAYAGRQRTSAYTNGGNSNTFNLYNASVGVSYTLDLFGGSRRRLEALQAQVDFQRYQYEAAYLALAANIVTTAIREAALRDEIAASREILAAQEKQLELITRQFELGATGKIAVLAQQTEVAVTKATLPPLEKELALTRHA